jgi:hypothetical protein
VEGALDARARELITVDAEKMNSLLFCTLVERLVGAFRQTPIEVSARRDSAAFLEAKMDHRIRPPSDDPCEAKLPAFDAAARPGQGQSSRRARASLLLLEAAKARQCRPVRAPRRRRS